MDEAERCHRLAILDRGALVADGTPGELTAKLKGRTFLVETADPRRTQHVLVDVPGVLGVAQVGNTLRVLTTDDAGDATQRMDKALADAGQKGEVTPAPPNLEDVFVAATRNGDAKDDGEERAA
jgi:ABC-2 type transport system ATP-binding protein